MKCAMEVLEVKKSAEIERMVQHQLEEQQRAQKRAEARKQAEAATVAYAEGIVRRLTYNAKHGYNLQVSDYFDSDHSGYGLYQVMEQVDRNYSNGIHPWCKVYNAPLLDMGLLVNMLRKACYAVTFSECCLYVNSCRTEWFYHLTVTVPNEVPCK